MIVKRKEYETLDKALGRAVNEGSGSTIFVTGEPGIGKSTFIKDYLENIDPAGGKKILTGSGYCLDVDGVSRSYLPWKEILFDIDAATAAKNSGGKKKDIGRILKTVIDETGTDWIKLIPYVGDIGSAVVKSAKTLSVKDQVDIETGEVVSVEFKNRLLNVMNNCGGDWLSIIPVVGSFASVLFKTSKALRKDSAKINIKNQQDFFDQVMNRLRYLSKNNILILFFDDLQWADISSLNLFYYISLNLQNKPYPLILIGTYRPQDVKEGRLSAEAESYQRHPLEEKLNNLARYNAYEEISLSRFSGIQATEYINNRFPGNSFDNKFISGIHKLTCGNILFLGELLNSLEEEGKIYNEAGTFKNSKNIIYSVLPGSIIGVIKERYNRIAENNKEFLRVASVIGNNFPAELLGRIMNENVIQMFNRIESLKNKHDIITNSETPIEKFSRVYKFSHKLMQKYIYYNIDEEFRREYHKIVFEEYDNFYKSDDLSGSTPFYSYHFGIGNKITDENNNIIINNESIRNVRIKDAAVIYSGLQKKLSEHYESTFSYDEELEAYNHIINLAKLLQNNADTAAYLLKKAGVLKLKGNWQEAESILGECITISEENSLKTLQAKAYNSLGRLHELNGKYKMAEDYMIKSLNMFDELNDPSGKSEAAGNLSVVYKHINEIQKAKQYAESQLQICSDTNDKKGMAFAYGNLAFIFSESGEPEKAESYYNYQLKIYTELNDISGISYATGNIGIIHFAKDEFEEALACYNKQLEICNELQDIRGIARTLGNIGTVYLEKNDSETAIINFEKQLNLTREIGDKRGQLYALLNLGIAHYETAKEISRNYFTEALPFAEELSDQKALQFCREYLNISAGEN